MTKKKIIKNMIEQAEAEADEIIKMINNVNCHS